MRGAQAGLSTRKAGYLSLLYLVLFATPPMIFSLDVGFYFWLVVGSSLGLGILAFARGSHTLQFYYIFFVFVMLFGYLLQFGVGIRFIPGQSVPTKVDSTAATILIAHFAGLALGTILFSRPRPPVAASASRQNRDFSLWGIVMITGLVLIAIFFGGYDRLFSVRATDTGQSTSSFVIFLVFVCKAAAYVYVALSISMSKERMPLPVKAWLFILFVAATVFASPVNTARLVSLSGILLVVVAYLSKTRRTKKLLTMFVFGALLSVLILPVTTLMRDGVSNLSWVNVYSIYSGLEMSSIQLMLNGVQTASQIPTGNLVISGLLIFVPSSIFTSKAGSVGASVASTSGYVYSNVALPSFFVGYLDYGIAGVFLMSIAMGAIFRFGNAYDGVDLTRRKYGYGAVLVACAAIVARGDFSTAMIAIYAFLIAFEIMRFASRLRVSVRDRGRLPET